MFRPGALQVKAAALFEESAAAAVARCISRCAEVGMVRVPMSGGCLQRQRALITIRSIHALAPRPVVYMLQGFFGFLDADDEVEDMRLLQNMRDSGIQVVSECALEFYPGDARRVFATDVLESSFMTVAEVLRVEFQGGEEVLSLGLNNLSKSAFQLSRLSYQVVVANDPNRRGEHRGEAFVQIPQIEDRVGEVLVSHDVPLDGIVEPGDFTLPTVSVPIRHLRFCSEEGLDDRPSLYQRVQIFGSEMHNGIDSGARPEFVLTTTGWLLIAGPDGSEGATIIGDISQLRVGPMEELAQRATRLAQLNRDWLEHSYSPFTLTSQAIQFRTMPVGGDFRSVVHVYTATPGHACSGSPVVDAFVLGSPRGSKQDAREAAATAAMSLLGERALCPPFPRDLEAEADTP